MSILQSTTPVFDLADAERIARNHGAEVTRLSGDDGEGVWEVTLTSDTVADVETSRNNETGVWTVDPCLHAETQYTPSEARSAAKLILRAAAMVDELNGNYGVGNLTIADVEAFAKKIGIQDQDKVRFMFFVLELDRLVPIGPDTLLAEWVNAVADVKGSLPDYIRLRKDEEAR